MMHKILAFLLLLQAEAVYSQAKQPMVKTAFCTVELTNQATALWTYRLKSGGKSLAIAPPTFEVDGKSTAGLVRRFLIHKPVSLSNGVTEQRVEGALRADSSVRLAITFRWAPDNPVVRFQYTLQTRSRHALTKQKGKDNFTYLTCSAATLPKAKEVRFSEFNEKYHAFTLTETQVADRFFDNAIPIMGPMLVLADERQQFLLAYEHGSQFPDRFLEFQLHPDRSVSLRSVKGNYLHQQSLTSAQPYQTVWFEVAGVQGNENALAKHYRQFMLRYISENQESRQPYIFYNTWGRQERTQWAGGKYLSSMNLKTTLAEIDVAHQMGVDVYVIDAGWFLKTGDWQVNRAFFPDTLRQVKARLDQYSMKLGLWFNPIVAAQTSRMLANNRQNRMSRDGKTSPPAAIWETEESVHLSLVSPYWEDFANELIRLTKELGVSYFKWDAVGQYGSNAAGHFNGTEANLPQERADSYAFQLPIYLSKVIDKVVKAAPQAIVDFDITEGGRCVGLQFLASGKYFIINNGPYYHNFDLAPEWKSPLPSGNANIFVEPGPARGWFVRSILTYDKWIPSVLFLSHYQPDEPRNSQTINLASLILGQNGIWGEILKTSPEGVAYFQQVLSRYKQVRDDITNSFPVVQGEPGNSPEIHEKIDRKTGRGAVSIFANTSGQYTYITDNKVDPAMWTTEGITVTIDAKGRAIIQATFTSPGAGIVFFGTH